MPIKISHHTAFQVNLADLHASPASCGPAASNPPIWTEILGRTSCSRVDAGSGDLLRDPDNDLLEFITMLPDAPRPELGVLVWSTWIRRNPSTTSH